MKNGLVKMILLFSASLMLTGCAGSLSDEEYDALVEYIEENTDIEDIEKEETQGAGEGEKITYKLSGTLDDEEKNFELKQVEFKGSDDTGRIYQLADVTNEWESILYIKLNDDGSTEEYIKE